MKKFVLIIFFYLFTSVSNSNSEDKINIGIFLGFSGLVETLTPSMADSIELPFKEIVSLENFFNNMKFKLFYLHKSGKYVTYNNKLIFFIKYNGYNTTSNYIKMFDNNTVYKSKPLV